MMTNNNPSSGFPMMPPSGDSVIGMRQTDEVMIPLQTPHINPMKNPMDNDYGDNSAIIQQQKRDKEDIKWFENFMKAMIILSGLGILFAFVQSGGIIIQIFVFVVCIGSFFTCLMLTKELLSKRVENKHRNMKKVADAIKEGAEAFLKTQYGTIATIAVGGAVLIFIIYLIRGETKGVPSVIMATITSFSFLLGSFSSGLAGYIGVWTSVRVNMRVAMNAEALDYPAALKTAFRGGGISSILSAAMCLLGITLLYQFNSFVLINFYNIAEDAVPLTLGGFGFGASFVALFMQLGGGIYTKAADVGADLVGKIENDIPEDDPRNPAVIADLVGDNVGDCAGSMADVFESISCELVGAMILGLTLAQRSELENPSSWLYFPLAIHAVDLIVSIVGIISMRAKSSTEDALKSMTRAFMITIAGAIILLFFFCYFMLNTEKSPTAWWKFFLCSMTGVILCYLLVFITQYYTDAKFLPVQKIVQASQTGHATNIIQGLSVGFESTGLPIVAICIALLISYSLGESTGLYQGGIFGTSVATMGMLSMAVFILSMNNLGAIVDNAGGIVEMGDCPEESRVLTDRLDSVGNVTKACTKGFAVGGSALSCFVLFQAFLDEMSMHMGKVYEVVNITQVETLIGGMCGIMVVFLFSGWSFDAVGNAAHDVVLEVRAQFAEDPGIMAGTSKPKYGRCVRIVTRAALRQMVRPALLAFLSPVAIGLIFKWIGGADRPTLGVDVSISFQIFGSLTSLVLAIMLDCAGGAWDNAKKKIEESGRKKFRTTQSISNRRFCR
mmetsp:Transcript_13575/g.20525  ORF Transcript_13575/g.20525 Transcript_13575/m.20525 type:complete len:784 (+) Transcript_13575:83-2434(+)